MRVCLIACCVALGACAARPSRPATASDDPARDHSPPPPPEVAAPEGPREVFPFVRVDREAGFVEIDGIVPIDAHHPRTPRVYLEAIVCATDTKDHESLVATRARPSHVHAALLLLGIEPGRPGTWDWSGTTIRAVPPQGPRVVVEILVEGKPQTPADWVVSARDGRKLGEAEPGEGFLFAGSQGVRRQSREMYRADGEGCIVGLTTFGGEVIAWSRMHSPEADIEEPVWIANKDVVPPVGTPVVVRIRRVGHEAER